jgi:hypothetical protein
MGARTIQLVISRFRQAWPQGVEWPLLEQISSAAAVPPDAEPEASAAFSGSPSEEAA